MQREHERDRRVEVVERRGVALRRVDVPEHLVRAGLLQPARALAAAEEALARRPALDDPRPAARDRHGERIRSPTASSARRRQRRRSRQRRRTSRRLRPTRAAERGLEAGVVPHGVDGRAPDDRRARESAGRPSPNMPTRNTPGATASTSNMRRDDRLPPSMTRLSQYLLPTEKEAPADAEALCHKLLVRAGLARQLGAGCGRGCPRAGACTRTSRRSSARS